MVRILPAIPAPVLKRLWMVPAAPAKDAVGSLMSNAFKKMVCGSVLVFSANLIHALKPLPKAPAAPAKDATSLPTNSAGGKRANGTARVFPANPIHAL